MPVGALRLYAEADEGSFDGSPGCVVDSPKGPYLFAAHTTTATSQPTNVGRRHRAAAHWGSERCCCASVMNKSTTSLRFASPSPGRSTTLISAVRIARTSITTLKMFNGILLSDLTSRR